MGRISGISRTVPMSQIKSIKQSHIAREGVSDIAVIIVIQSQTKWTTNGLSQGKIKILNTQILGIITVVSTHCGYRDLWDWIIRGYQNPLNELYSDLFDVIQVEQSGCTCHFELIVVFRCIDVFDGVICH